MRKSTPSITSFAVCAELVKLHWARFITQYGDDKLEQQPLDMQLGLFVTNLITAKGIKPQMANQ